MGWTPAGGAPDAAHRPRRARRRLHQRAGVRRQRRPAGARAATHARPRRGPDRHRRTQARRPAPQGRRPRGRRPLPDELPHPQRQAEPIRTRVPARVPADPARRLVAVLGALRRPGHRGPARRDRPLGRNPRLDHPRTVRHPPHRRPTRRSRDRRATATSPPPASPCTASTRPASAATHCFHPTSREPRSTASSPPPPGYSATPSRTTASGSALGRRSAPAWLLRRRLCK